MSMTISIIIGHFKNKLYGNAFYLMLNSLITALLGLIFWNMATKMSVQQDVGISAAIISTINLLVNFSNLGLGNGYIRFYNDSKGRALGLFISSIIMLFLSSLIFSLLFVLANKELGLLQIYINWDLINTGVFIWIVFFINIFLFFDNVFVALGDAMGVVIKNTVCGAVKIILLLLMSLHSVPHAIILSFSVGTLISCLLSFGMLLKRLNKICHGDLLFCDSTFLKYSLANYVNGMLWSAAPLLLPIIIINYAGPSANAVFFIGWMIANMLFIIPTALTISLFAHSSADNSYFKNNLNNVISLNLIMVLLGNIFIIAVGSKLLGMFGENYKSGYFILIVLLLSAFPFSFNSIILTIYKLEKNNLELVLIGFLVCFAVLPSCLFFTPKYGALGTALGWLTGQTAVAVLSTVRLNRRFRLINISIHNIKTFLIQNTNRGRNYNEALHKKSHD